MPEPEKYFHKLPPCPLYDTEGIESWLEDLSRDGLTLQEESPFLGFLSFVPSTPRPVRYRMEPALKSQGFFDSAPNCPPEDAIALHEAFGWDFVIPLGEFFLYRSYDPHARETNTDPQIQELTLKQLKKRQRSALIAEILGICLHICFGFLGYPVMLLVSLGTLTSLCLAALLLIALMNPLFLIIHLEKQCRRLNAGDDLHRHKDWRRGQLRHYAAKALPVVLFLVFCVGMLSSLIRQEDSVPLADYEGSVPFVTMGQLIPESSFTRTSSPWLNELTVWKDPLIPQSFDYSESGKIVTPDGQVLDGSLFVKYHETAAPFLARQLMQEFLRYADKGKYYDGTAVPDYDTGSVTVFTYQGRYGLNTLLMQYETIVLEANILIYDEADQPLLDLWIQSMVSMLTEQENRL